LMPENILQSERYNLVFAKSCLTEQVQKIRFYRLFRRVRHPYSYPERCFDEEGERREGGREGVRKGGREGQGQEKKERCRKDIFKIESCRHTAGNTPYVQRLCTYAVCPHTCNTV